MGAWKPRTATVIGAGIAGLACAHALARAGMAVRVLDKGRVPGGRVATRHSRDGNSFDHGAQYATARDPAFRALCDELLAEGVLAEWPAASVGEPRYVGVPNMAAIGAALTARVTAAGGEVAQSRQATWLHAGADGIGVRHDDADNVRPGELSETGGALDPPCDVVVVAVPPLQAAPLLATAGYEPDLGSVAIAPCWTLMVTADARMDGPDIVRPNDGPLGWIERESSKPGRAATPDCWVAQATAAWSVANLERAADDVAAELARAWANALGVTVQPASARAHRWRYSMTTTPLGVACLWDASRKIGVCGDWCIGGRVEAAFLSGTAMARAILGVAA